MRENVKKQAYSAKAKKGSRCVWLSKKWLDDWCTDEFDEDSTDINKLIMCEHDSLSPSAPRLSVTGEVWNSLSQIFPCATLFEIDVAPCPICQSKITKRKQEQDESKTQREKERVRNFSPTLKLSTKNEQNFLS